MKIIGPRFPRSNDWCRLSRPVREWTRDVRWGALFIIRGEPRDGMIARRELGMMFYVSNHFANRLRHPEGVRPPGS